MITIPEWSQWPGPDGHTSPPGRLRLAHLPTPFEPMGRLSAEIGGPRLWIKRDDCTGLAGGGNKARKLEYLLAAAVESGADTVLTAGAAQSNHARQTAAACAMLGLACELFVDVPLPGTGAGYVESGNMLIDRLVGATVHVIATRAGFGDANADLEDAVAARATELRRQGRRPYCIPLGGSTGLGALAYVHAAHELAEQCASAGIRPDAVVLATSSGSTHVGLVAGFAHVGWKVPVIGVCVAGGEELIRQRSQKVVDDLRRLGVPALGADRLHIDFTQIGPGYGEPTPAGTAAIGRVARAEGILLDPVYTGKAMAGLFEMVSSGGLAATRHVVFLHTGGWPALFGYLDMLMAADGARLGGSNQPESAKGRPR